MAGARLVSLVRSLNVSAGVALLSLSAPSVAGVFVHAAVVDEWPKPHHEKRRKLSQLRQKRCNDDIESERFSSVEPSRLATSSVFRCGFKSWAGYHGETPGS